MRYIQLITILFVTVLVSCTKSPTSQEYPQADAVYLKLNKTYVLNQDGSIDMTVEKAQKLFTYRAFHTYYGETIIPYNPDFQSVKINDAYTVMADGKKVIVPDNGYNEVLPRYCTNSKAHNKIREYVITHTGLERDATIFCSYTVHTKPGAFPYMVFDEKLATDCPVQKYKITVKVPDTKNINPVLLNTTGWEIRQKQKQQNGYTVASWTLKDTPVLSTEGHQHEMHHYVPQLLVTTSQSIDESLNPFVLNETFNADASPEIKKYISKKFNEKQDNFDKIFGIHKLVVNEINTVRVPFSLTGFNVRMPEEVWSCNSGTPIEKCCLMAALLRSEGFDAKVAIKTTPYKFVDGRLYETMFDPYVYVNPNPETSLYLSVNERSTNELQKQFAGYKMFSLSKNKTPELPQSTFNNEIEKITVSAQLKLDSKGNLTGKAEGNFNTIMLELKKELKVVNSLFLRQKGTVVKRDGLNATIEFDVNKKEALKAQGDYLFLEIPEVSKGFSSHHFLPLPDKRTTPFDAGKPIKEEYQYTIEMPDGYKLLNNKIEMSDTNKAGTFAFSIKQTGNTLKIIKQIHLKSAVYNPEAYPDFKTLVNHWHLDRYNQLIFKRI